MACSALIDVTAGLTPDVENPTSGGVLGPSGSTLGPPSGPMERRNNFVLVFAPCPRNRGVFELSWSRELTMLASLGAELLMLTRCAVGGGCGAIGWRS